MDINIHTNVCIVVERFHYVSLYMRFPHWVTDSRYPIRDGKLSTAEKYQ